MTLSATDAASPAEHTRRLVRVLREEGGADEAALEALTEAVGRHDSPVDLCIRGGLGSGRRALAESLYRNRGLRARVEDVDELAAPGAPVGAAPDVEILTLCTAPCRHEERWSARPRAHTLLVVATGLRPADPLPAWARGLPTFDPEASEGPEVDALLASVDRALATVPAVRALRLEAELELLASRLATADVAEAALCGHTETALCGRTEQAQRGRDEVDASEPGGVA